MLLSIGSKLMLLFTCKWRGCRFKKKKQKQKTLTMLMKLLIAITAETLAIVAPATTKVAAQVVVTVVQY